MIQDEISTLAALRKSRVQSDCVIRQSAHREQSARNQIENLRRFARLRPGYVQLNVCALADRLEAELATALGIKE